MPYIPQERRVGLDPAIERTIRRLNSANGPALSGKNSRGDLNYVLSKIVWLLYDQQASNQTANDLLGVLDIVRMEFYRRRVAPYEDEKLEENGDL